jgi:hypothetical protein
MKAEKLEVTRGSGNVFRDLGHKNADAEQFKAILAAAIIKALDRDRLTVRAAHDRNADLGRFTGGPSYRVEASARTSNAHLGIEVLG